MSDLIQHFGQGESYSFHVKGRERFIQQMMRAGYVEIDLFEGKESKWGYFCYSCPAYKDDDASITGYTCAIWKFPDMAHGCCGSWKPMPEVESVQKG